MPVFQPVILKLFGLIVASAIIFSPTTENKPIVNENHNLENAQIIADHSGETVKVWMDKSGHVNIQRAGDKPIEPYVILHSTWKPRK